MSRKVTRELTFHQVFTEDIARRSSKSRRDRELARDYATDWRELLDAVSRVGIVDDGLGYVAYPETEPPCLSIVRPAKRGFAVHLRQHEAAAVEIQDVADSEDFDLANASAYYFLSSPPGVVVVMQGDPTGASPPATALLSVLGSIAPQGPEREWKIAPLVAPSDLERLKRADAVTRARFTASTGSDLFSFQDLPELGQAGDAGAASIGRALQKRLGIPLEIKVDLRLPKEYATRDNGQRLRDLFIEEAAGMRFGDDGPRVTVERSSTAEIEDDVLTLASHKLTTRVILEQSDDDGLSFTTLREHTGAYLARGGEAFIRKAMGDT